MIKESGFITLPIAIFFSAIILSGSAFFIVKKVDNRDIKNESENNIEEIFLVDEISIDNETESDIDVSKPAIDTKDGDSLKTVVQTKNNTPVVKNIQEELSLIKDEVTSLQIKEIKTNISKDKVTVYWETTIDSRSRLIMNNGNGKVYESDNGLSTFHKVDIYDLKSSTKYDYKIIATTEDKKGYDDYYSSFTAFMNHVFSLVKNEQDDCVGIYLKDTTGKPMAGINLKIRGVNKYINTQGVTVSSYKQEIVKQTDSNGLIKYCDDANHFEVYGDLIDLTYLVLEIPDMRNNTQNSTENNANNVFYPPFING